MASKKNAVMNKLIDVLTRFDRVNGELIVPLSKEIYAALYKEDLRNAATDGGQPS